MGATPRPAALMERHLSKVRLLAVGTGQLGRAKAELDLGAIALPHHGADHPPGPNGPVITQDASRLPLAERSEYVARDSALCSAGR
ncbi:MAG: hypothetical protein HYS77_03985 [Candidatus Rokubacteria bacterium]|nr:hypothetical protein [Candidatus Rokubacteria bacterium]